MIFARACRSAEQDTAIATGQDAPWRGSRTTRTSWQKYLPPNCAPMPKPLGELEDLRLELEVAEAVRRGRALGRAACPGSCAEAYFAVFSANSALVPPTTIARWYGGQAAVPRDRSFSSRNVSIRSGFRTALVSWYRNDLLALPPPLAMNRKLVRRSAVGRGVQLDLGRQVGAGVLLVPHGQRRHLGVAQVEPRVRVVHAAADAPRRRRRRSAPVRPSCPSRSRCRCPGTSAAHRAAAMLAFLSRSRATNRSLPLASGSSMMRAQLAQVSGPQVVRDVVHRLVGERGSALRARPAGTAGRRPRRSRPPRVVTQPVLGLVRPQREQVGVGELRFGRQAAGYRPARLA